MELSDSARSVIGILFITIPIVEFGGYFLLSRLRQWQGASTDSELAQSYYRAGHAHAGVWVILAIIAQPLIDVANFAPSVSGLVRAGFWLPPILISAGFFLGAPKEGNKPGQAIILVYVAAVVLAISSVVLGLTLALGGNAP